MSSLKLMILPKQARQNGECQVYIRLIHNNKSTRIKTDFYVLPHNWNKGKIQGGRAGDKNATRKNIDLTDQINDYEKLLVENKETLSKLDANSVKKFLESGTEFYETDFFKYTEERIAEFTKNHYPSTRNVINMLTMVKNYHGKSTLNINDINKRFLEGFQSYYQQKKHKQNSIATYLRYIRLIFNSAMDDFNTNPRNPVITGYPFRKFEIKTEKTANRNLSVDTIRRIRDYEFKTKREEITKDVFMLQTYLLGVNIIDLFSMPKTALIDGRLQFSRIKTKRFYNIKIEPEVKLLIDKYKGKRFLFWFADHCGRKMKVKHARQEEFQYSNTVAFNKMLNTNLETIQKALQLKLPTDLTTYYARHSFASLMREIGISKDTISLALGHKDVEQNLKTSGIYINEDFEDVDIANRELIDFINSDCEDGKAWKESKIKKSVTAHLNKRYFVDNPVVVNNWERLRF